MGMIAGGYTVSEGRTYDDLVTEPTSVDGTVGIPNLSQGRITLTGTPTPRFVSVTYNAGLQVDENSPDHYKNVPNWLQDAAIKHSTIWLDRSHPTVRHDDADQAKHAVMQNEWDLETMLKNYIRYFPMGEHPLNG